MLSQHLSSDNIINSFFPLLEMLVAAKNLHEIDGVVNRVLHYADQPDINRCETFLIKALHKFIEFRLQQIHCKEGERVNVKELIAKTDPRKTETDDRNEVELAFDLYIFIVASIINLPDGQQPLARLDIDDCLSEILSIKQAMHRHKNMMAMITIPTEGNIHKAVFVSLRMANMSFVFDCDPVKSKDHFTVAIASLFVQKLLNLYNQLEARIRPLDMRMATNQLPDGLQKVEYRQLQDGLAVIAAMMRGMNMFNFKDERLKLTEQKAKNSKPSRLAEHTLWDAGQKIDLVDYLYYYTPYSHVIIDQCCMVLQYLNFVKDYQVEIPDYLQPTLAYRLQSLYHQIRILMQAVQIQYAQLSMHDKLKVETILGMLDNWLVCLLYAVYRLNPALLRITPELRQSLDGIEKIAVSNLDLTLVASEKLCLTTAALYETKIAVLLSNANNKEQRLEIFTDFMLKYMDLLLSYNDFISFSAPDEINITMVKRFIIEYFLLVLLQARHQTEMEILLNNVLLEDVIGLMVGLEVEPIYRYILISVCKYKAKFCDLDDINAHFYKNLEQDDQKTALYYFNKAMHARLSATFNVSTRLEGFLILHGSYFADALGQHPVLSKDPVHIRAAKQLEYYILRMTETASGYLTTFLAKSQFHKPVRFVDVKSTFATTETRVTRRVSLVSKKKAEVIEPAIEAKSLCRIEETFAVVLAAHDHDLAKVIRFYESAIKDRKKSSAIYGLLGLAECLTKMSAGKEKSALYHRTRDAATAILDGAKQRLIWGMDHAAFVAHYHSLLIRSGMERPQVVDRVDTAKPVPKPAPRQVIITATKEVFFKVVHFQPAPKRERIPFYDMCKPIHDERMTENLKNILTSHGKAVANCMHLDNLIPLVQGGAVLDALFNIPHRDVDLMCFATKADMLKFYNKHKDVLHMQSYRFNKNANVMVIQFDCEKVGLANAEVEILFIEEKDKYALDTALIKLARGFGINLVLYYDPILDRLIDPLNQLRRILDSREIDVGSFFAVSLIEYFAEHPERMLDTLYKMAKYHHFGVNLQISDDVANAFMANRKRLTQYFFAKEVFQAKFDKLFLQGFAVKSLAMLMDPRFDCVYKCFPNLDIGFIDDLKRACVEIDAAMAAPENHSLTYIKREELRAQFLDTVLYHSFCYKRDLSLLNEDNFAEASSSFILATNFAVTNELIARVQAIWSSRLKPAKQTRCLH